MTDLPQHLALASILLHHDDPRFGFAAFYDVAWGQSLYWLQSLLALALAPVIGLEVGMRVVVVLSLALLPIGVLALLRALQKPEWLALLALPLVYNRAFFWGFTSFQLALGFALLALAILVRPPRGVASEIALAALCTLIVFTHPYGLLMIAGYVAVWLVVGDRRALRRHALGLSPLALGVLAWGFLAGSGSSAGTPTFDFDPLLERLDDFEESVLGGYRDASEAWLLIAYLALWAALAARAFPLSRARWRALAPAERTLWLFVGANLLLFAVVPANTSVVGELHIRHALIATCLFPALAPVDAGRGHARAARIALVALAAVATANAWWHLIRFDREARGFDAVVEQIPFGSRIVALTWDANGEVMRTWPYWHFSAYAQARRGGLIAQSFPRMFWNLPVRGREDAGIPDSPSVLFAKPQLYDAQGFGSFYDTVLVRTRESGRWQVSKRP